MDVETLEITKEDAQKEYKAYLEACKKQAAPYYNKMRSVYYHAKKGAKIIDVREAIIKAGLNDDKHPKFAIARADMNRVALIHDQHGWRYVNPLKIAWAHLEKSEPVFNMEWAFETAPTIEGYRGVIQAPVPKIPPQHIPPGNLKDYYILWEVEKWQRRAPTDPILLKKIPNTKSLFIVLAQWDLTPLERKILTESTVLL